jgi:hypothetical protein
MIVSIILIVTCLFHIWFLYKAFKMWKEQKRLEREWHAEWASLAEKLTEAVRNSK